ncbi:MAG TPA: M23 family metallopeptidase [Verrucomicrobiales bacterium]|nr:M23 family metallopeptidase [Verrucomicrobiales bacterium]
MATTTAFRRGVLTAGLGLAGVASALAAGPRIILPTGNRALLEGRPQAYYMFVDRTFEGVKTAPWEGGQYGFHRNPKRSGGSLVYSRFHEGIDIRPVKRDGSGEPLDEVWSSAEGVVAYVNTEARRSSYGRYVVVRHDWAEGPVYSLYAHLGRTAVRAGQPVRPGSVLGRMGYTGTGIDRRRAHLHFEFNLLLNGEFDAWHARHYAEPNHHGAYNGINFAGVDPARFLVRNAGGGGGAWTIRDEVGSAQPYFRVAVPGRAKMELLHRYPWLRQGSANAKAWEIAFSDSGLPLAVRGIAEVVTEPRLVWVRPSPHPHSFRTRARLSGQGGEAKLTKTGREYVELAAGLF